MGKCTPLAPVSWISFHSWNFFISEHSFPTSLTDSKQWYFYASHTAHCWMIPLIPSFVFFFLSVVSGMLLYVLSSWQIKGIISVTAFDFKKDLKRDTCYIIHNCKKNVYQGRSQLEIDESTVIEETKDLCIENFCMEMSENEDDQDQELKGEVSGIVCGSVNLYDACLRCKKKLQNEVCPNRCNSNSKYSY